MKFQSIPWLVVLGMLVAIGVALAAWGAAPRRTRKSVALPTEWRLGPRLVFSTAERRFYRLLHEALPNQVLLCKLPLVRFCQPTEPDERRYWYELLGTSHVSFAVCASNGRVLAAIDLAIDQPLPKRALQIKQSVLDACRVRYLRFSAERLPTLAELQLLVPDSGAPVRPLRPVVVPASELHQARDSLANTVASRRAERTALWQDSSFFQDSFFATDSRLDGFAPSEFLPGTAERGDDAAGVVVDAPPVLRTQSRR